MKKIDNYDFYSSKFLDFYLSGTISFSFMLNVLSLPIFLDLLNSKSLFFRQIQSRKVSSK